MSTGRLSGLVALITGGSSGIGEGCVRRFCDAGAKVVFCSNQPDEGQALASSLGHDTCVFVEADCRVEDDIKRVVATAVEKFGSLDCLVNNVGTHPPITAIDDIKPDDFRHLFELNVMSTFIFSQQALPHLRRSKRSPSIVNIGSMVNVLGQAGAVTYVATKGAIASMTRALAIDEAAYGVRVNTVSPSNVDTPLMQQGIREAVGENATASQFDAQFSSIANMQVSGRMATTEDIGNVCVFLASSEASFLTGIDIYASGGSELNYGDKCVPKKSA